jgi:hypothetical protein
MEQRTGDKEQKSETWNRGWDTKGGKIGTVREGTEHGRQGTEK